MADSERHQVSVKLTTEDYGWLARYSEKNDMSMAAVIRKALKMYRLAVQTKKTAKQDKEE